MKVYMIRGQGSGIRTDRVFLRPPTDAELKEALAEELARHGIGPGGKAKELWVGAVAVEAVGDAKDLAGAEPKGHPRLSGKLDEATIAKLNAAPARSKTGTAESQIAMSGEGKVVNPPK